MSNTCDDPNWPERFRRPTPAAKRAKLVEEIGWALKDQQAEIDSLKGLLMKSMSRTRELEDVILWHLQECKSSISAIAEFKKRANVGKR